MAAKPAAEEPPHGETLKYQTWVLRVLIHCDGCEKRVKKILQGIDGVYKTEVDSRLHKVTVIGNVDAETLIKRLSRSGKSVQLWPEKPPEKKDSKKSAKSSKAGDGGDNNNKKKEKEDQKNNSEPVGEGGGSKEGCNIDAADEDSDKEEGQSDECEGGGGGEGSGKKKKKKKKKKNKGEDGGSVPPPNNNKGGGGKEISTVDTAVPENKANSKDLIGPPIQVQHAYPYPPPMYYSPPPPPPAYGLSYNTAYPISSASYYVGAPVMPMHAYTAYPRLPPPPPPSDPIKYHGDNEDEYEGGFCSIM